MMREREWAACEGLPVLGWPGTGGLDEGEVESDGLGTGGPARHLRCHGWRRRITADRDQGALALVAGWGLRGSGRFRGLLHRTRRREWPRGGDGRDPVPDVNGPRKVDRNGIRKVGTFGTRFPG